ncbi:MAG: hypothetical protein Rpha_1660 [Candidatus Ruthia sp. Apha_13_S6]|nr:hypothetical protein [Candidatus Ruthia sp. Apha_13_S6]
MNELNADPVFYMSLLIVGLAIASFLLFFFMKIFKTKP